MANGRNDVELIIRAKNEVTQTVGQIVASLKDLLGVQDAIGSSADKTEGLLGELGKQFRVLSNEVKALESLGQVAGHLDRAAAAVTRLEKASESAVAEQARLAAAVTQSAARTAQLGAAVQKTKADLDAQAASLKFLSDRVDHGSIAYLEQKAAVQTATVAHREANAALRASETQQRQLVGAAESAGAAAVRQAEALQAAKVEYSQIAAASAGASKALGGVEVRQDAVAAASQRAAADLDKVTAALHRQQQSPAIAGQTAATPAGPAAAATAAYRAQAAAVNEARSAFLAAQAEATQLGRQYHAAAVPTRELETAFVLAKAASREAETAYQTQAAALNNLKGVTQGSVGQFLQLQQAATVIRRPVAQVASGVEQAAAAVVNANKKRGLFLGLRPYELQNLSFQINDVFTQLASGTSVTQTLAQQGGQFAQLFPRVLGGVVRFIPEITAAVVVLGTLFAAFKNLGDLEDSARKFDGAISATADGAIHQADVLADTAHALDVYGTSLKNAREEINTFVSGGIDDSQIERFGITAENMAKVMGVKVPDAAQKMTEGFTGGLDAIEHLNKTTNFLTKAEYDHIKALFESGRAAEGRTEAFAIFERKMDEGARKAEGQWSSAVKNLTNAWDGFLTLLDKGLGLSNLARDFNGIIAFVDKLSAKLRGLKAVQGNPTIAREQLKLDNLLDEQAVAQAREHGGMPSRGRITQRARPLSVVNADVAAQQAKLAKLVAGTQDVVAQGSNRAAVAGEQVVQGLQDEYDALRGVNQQRRIQLAGQKEYDKALAVGADKVSADKARALGESIERNKVSRENQGAANSAASKARALQNKLDSMESQLASAEQGLDKKVAEGQVASLQQRLDVIDDASKKLKQEVADFRKLGGKDVNGESLDAFNARVDKNGELLKQQATLKFYTESIGDLEKKRDATLKSIQDRYADGSITAADAYAQSKAANDDLTKQIADMALTAEDFAKSIRGAVPDPKLEAFIANADRLRTAPTTGSNTAPAKEGRSLVAEEERKLNDIISARNTIVETQNALLEKGLITLDEWRANIEGAYAKTTPQILAQIDVIKQLLDTLVQQGAITTETYDAWLAKIELVKAETKNISTDILTVNDANQMIADAGVTVFDNFLQKVAEGRNALAAFGESVLQVAADFLREIGEMILKQALLNLLMKTGAGQKLAGGVNGLFSGAALLLAGAAVKQGGDKVLAGAVALGAAAVALQTAASTLLAANSVKAAASVLHGGGIAGSPSVSRSISPMIFAGAQRLHSGGIPGLRNGEVPAILMRNEEVLTRDDPRHILNGGGSGGAAGGAMSIRSILVDDPRRIPEAMASSDGEAIVISHIRRNAPTIRQALGIPAR